MKNPVDLRRLQCFVAVAEEQHFGRAAARLGMAQPPLTQQIQKLERELGFLLLHRVPRRTTLTDAGRVLLDSARRILRDVDTAIEETRRAGRGEIGRIVIGAPSSVMLAGLPTALGRFRERHPGVALVVQELCSTDVLSQLAEARLDVGFFRAVEMVGTAKATVLVREPVVAVLPKSHQLAARRHFSLKDLAGELFVFFPRHMGEKFYDELVGFCMDAGFAPNVVHYATEWPGVLATVETGLGVSIAPACVERIRLPGVVYRPLRRLRTNISVFAPEERRSPAVTAFLAALRNGL
jgi:DNA-binding transcriptional LysR family regulator